MDATVLKVKKKALDFVLERSMQVARSVCYGLKEEVEAGEERWGESRRRRRRRRKGGERKSNIYKGKEKEQG